MSATVHGTMLNRGKKLVRMVLVVGATVACAVQASSSFVTVTEGQLRILEVALMDFKIDNGRLPSAKEGLLALVINPDPANLPNWQQWMKEDALTDSWDRPFQFVRSLPGGLEYGIYSFGPDGVSRTGGNDPDDINTWRQHLPAQNPPWLTTEQLPTLFFTLGILLSLAALGVYAHRRKQATA